MMLVCSQTFLDGNCGVGVLYNFAHSYHLEKPDKRRTGLFVAGFVDNNSCEEAYKKLCSKFKLVYQSPLRPSENGNKKGYFLCVFDSK
jgi:hypothetical protein